MKEYSEEIEGRGIREARNIPTGIKIKLETRLVGVVTLIVANIQRKQFSKVLRFTDATPDEVPQSGSQN